jgi:preprotein translocase subunit SecD
MKTDYYLVIFATIFIISAFFVFTNFLKFKLGLDLAGGVILYYNADLTNIKSNEIDDTLASIKDLIERRINALGISEINISYSKSGRVIVEIPYIKDPKIAIDMIGSTPVLEFRIPFQVGTTTTFIPSKLTGKYLINANAVLNTQTGFPVVELEFNKEGAKIFEELTEKYINQPIAIYLDNKPISVPIVREKITGGKAIIEGKFNWLEAKELAYRLKQGALPVPLKLIGVSVVAPELGEKFLMLAIKGGFIGFILVALFMIFYYRIQGVISVIALILYVFLNLFIYKILGVVLSLSGITGFILSLGMAVDANILIAERIKEELRKNKIDLALELGFNRAWPSIRDSNISTIISVIFMYILTTSFVKGFALTLGLGVLTSMLTAVFFTKFLTFKIVPKFQRS